jgi:carboxylesterase type B
MVWINGDGESQGTGADPTFDGDSLVCRGDVVLVTINYRLNVFGLLALDDGVVTGNYALSDQIAALRWVQKYITAFGGNRDQVTVFGQSAGGGFTINLSVSPKARGLFHNAIVQSGSNGGASKAITVADAQIPIVDTYCNGTGMARLACLQELPAETLLNLTQKGLGGQNVIDSVFMLDYPTAQVAKGPDAVVPVNYLVGFMPDEGQSLMGKTFPPSIDNFTTVLDTLKPQGQISAQEAEAIQASGLWDEAYFEGAQSTSSNVSYTAVYNATTTLFTDPSLTCGGIEIVQVGAASSAYQNLYVYVHQRAYGLNYWSFFDLCTYPVEDPEFPYFRCHSGGLYEVFGTYYLFDLPVRSPGDIYYTNMVQDIFCAHG